MAEHTSNRLSENFVQIEGNKYSVLKTSGVYGANASGKSNLLLGIEALRYLICLSGDSKDGDPISCYEPFKLSSDTVNSPTKFEIEFLLNGLRYVYEVEFNSTKILSELLSYYPTTHPAVLFKRQEEDSWENIYFGSHYKGGKKKHPFFENSTYLSKAGNSADSPKIIRQVYNYFRSDIFRLGTGERAGVLEWKSKPDFVKKVSKILTKVDTGISGIRFDEEESENNNLKFGKEVPEEIKRLISKSEQLRPIFLHESGNGESIEFTKQMESSGTQKLYELLPLLLTSLSSGGVLLLDELDNSLHPHIAEFIIQLFNTPEVNVNNAQLLFTTHNINLMSPKILRRDQIWLTEKNNGETILIGLSEFDKSTVKQDSPFRKWYAQGRFGAIPRIDMDAITSIFLDEEK